MELVVSTPFQQTLDVVERLPAEDQKTLVDIIRRRLIEQRRAEIVRNAQATIQAFRAGRASYSTVDDLRRDLPGKP